MSCTCLVGSKFFQWITGFATVLKSKSFVLQWTDEVPELPIHSPKNENCIQATEWLLCKLWEKSGSDSWASRDVTHSLQGLGYDLLLGKDWFSCKCQNFLRISNSRMAIQCPIHKYFKVVSKAATVC